MKLEFSFNSRGDNETAAVGELYRVSASPDCDAESPREWDNVATMVCSNSRYILGDGDGIDIAAAAVRNSRDYRPTWEETETGEFLHAGRLRDCLDLSNLGELWQAIQLCGDIVTQPLYLYDHSGLSISTGKFSCPWDSGQIGFAFVTLETIRKETKWRTMCKPAVEWAAKHIEAETSVYDDYLSGSVYWFETERATEWDSDGEATEWESLDSCGGYYGYDHEKSGLAESALGAIRSDHAERVESLPGMISAAIDKIRQLVTGRAAVTGEARAAIQAAIATECAAVCGHRRELRLHYCHSQELAQ